MKFLKINLYGAGCEVVYDTEKLFKKW